MGRMVALRAGELICRVQPELGGCVAQLALGGEPVLRPPPAHLESARQSGSYPLVPFSNRIGGARLEWQGTLHPLVRNNGAEPHAIHGIGWQRAWDVLDSDERSMLLSFEHHGDASWPFAFDASQAVRVSPGAVEFTLSITNQSGRDAPAGLGWHPFFVKRPGATLALKTAGRWEMGEDKLPTRRVANSGIASALSALDVDHCYDGWDGVAHLRDSMFDIHVRSNLTRVVVFTTPVRDHIAIEPVSHVNNALALARKGDVASLGLVKLAPGETLSAQMTIEVERRS